MLTSILCLRSSAPNVSAAHLLFQPPHTPTKLRELRSLAFCQTGAIAGLDLRIMHPVGERLRIEAQLARDMRKRATLGLRESRQAHRPLTKLIGVLAPVAHIGLLSVDGEHSLPIPRIRCPSNGAHSKTTL